MSFVHVEVGGHLDDVPGTGFPVIGKIHKVLVIVEGKGHLIAVEGPRAELHDACLLVEREVGDVDRAGTLFGLGYIYTYIICYKFLIFLKLHLVDGRRNPQHFTVRINKHVRFVAHLVITVGTEIDNTFIYFYLNNNYKLEVSYLLNNTISGFHTLSGGNRKTPMPP